MLREGVEELVAGRVVGLARVAEDTRARRVHDERRERIAAGLLVQVPGAIELRAQHRGQAIGVERAQECVVEQTREVKHRADRPATLEDVFLELTGRSLDAEEPEQEAPT